MFLNKQNQTLYWLEAESESQNSGVFKKSTLSNFDPVVFGFYSGSISSLSDMYVSQDEVVYFMANNRLMTLENTITQELFQTNGSSRYFTIDEINNQIFYQIYNNLYSQNTDEVIFSGSWQYSHIDIKLDVDNERVYIFDTNNNQVVSFDYNGDNVLTHLEGGWNNILIFQVILLML